MAATFLSGVAAIAIIGIIPKPFAIALCGGGVLVAWVGWLDDRKSLPSSVRAAVHAVAAVWAVAWVGGFPSLNLGFVIVQLHVAGPILAVVGIIWSINLYNFMDGIDGLATSEAIVVAAVGGIFTAVSGSVSLTTVSWLLASACFGFLIWNWPPAKIFMGDVGSGLLGYVFAVLALASENSGTLPLLVWVILLGVFVVDTTATLIRRVVRGEKWHEPHRTHAYQLAIQIGYSHKTVTLGILGINLALATVAALTLIWPNHLLRIVLVSALVLLWIQRRLTKVGLATQPGVSRTLPLGF